MKCVIMLLGGYDMSDIYGYDELKKAIDKKKEDDIDFNVKMTQVFDEEYRKTGFYNGYDARGKALQDHAEIQRLTAK